MMLYVYCGNYDDDDRQEKPVLIKEPFGRRFEENCNALDRYIYLSDWYKIICSCAEDFRLAEEKENAAFWQINKYLLNYLNAVYSYKEFLNKYVPSVKETADNFYNAHGWYRFVCDYRNRVIHQTMIIKNYLRTTHEAYINLDEMMDVLDADIDTIKKKSHKENAEHFREKILSIAESDQAVEIRGNRYLSMQMVISEADKELSRLNDDVLSYAFEKGVIPVFEWLFSHLCACREADGYRYTFVVNEQFGFDYDITFTLEDFFRYLLQRFGKESSICKKAIKYLKEKEYLYIFDEKMPLDAFAEKYG